MFSLRFRSLLPIRGLGVRAESPSVCRNCGLITVDGKVVSLPEELEKAARGMALAQDEATKKSRAELEDCPDDRVEQYMAKFFKVAYLEGFFRALAFFRHENKGGRMVRLRELWSTGVMTSHIRPGGQRPNLRGLMMEEAAYTEFEKLLNLSAIPGEPDARSQPTKQATEQDNPPPLS